MYLGHRMSRNKSKYDTEWHSVGGGLGMYMRRWPRILKFIMFKILSTF